MGNILSVGIDVGTSTTQLVFSRIEMENTSGYFSVPRICVTAKEVIYKSDIYLTPLKTETLREKAAAEVESRGLSVRQTETLVASLLRQAERPEKEEKKPPVVDYVREAYIHQAEEVRITFDKQLHTAEPPHGLADYLFRSILICKVCRNAHHTDVGVPRCRLRFFSHGVKSRCVPAYQGKVKTKGGQFESDCLSDSSRRSCYDRFTFHLYSRILCFQD